MTDSATRLWRRAFWATITLIGIAAAALAGEDRSEEPGRAGLGVTPVLVADIDGAIGPATADYVELAIDRAVSRGAAALVLRMDTPGGLVSATRTIVRDIVAAPVPVIVYVAPSGARAASAGTYITYASHVAAMAPGTNIGAATPIVMGGSTPLPGMDEDTEDESDSPADTAQDAGEAKMINDAVAFLRSLAEMRGRNQDWAEKAVREAATLSASQALDESVVEYVASSLSALLESVDGHTVTLADDREVRLETAGAPVEEVAPGLVLEVLAFITNPNVAFILLMLGIYGLIFEFMSPGVFLPGTVGVICLVLGLYALHVLPFSYTGGLLMVLGVALMVGEAFVPSFGALGIGGAIAFIFGAGMLIDTDAPGFTISWYVVAGAAGLTLALAMFVLSAAIGSSRRRVPVGTVTPANQAAEVVSWSGETGMVVVAGETWPATGNGPFKPGETVWVLDANGRTLIVTRGTG